MLMECWRTFSALSQPPPPPTPPHKGEGRSKQAPRHSSLIACSFTTRLQRVSSLCMSLPNSSGEEGAGTAPDSRSFRGTSPSLSAGGKGCGVLAAPAGGGRGGGGGERPA